MPDYKITCTITIHTDAEDEDEALEIGMDSADWGSADWYVEECDDEEDL